MKCKQWKWFFEQQLNDHFRRKVKLPLFIQNMLSKLPFKSLYTKMDSPNHVNSAVLQSKLNF